MTKPDLKLPKTYKTLLMLALVGGPFIWLAFTEDGQRRTDLAVMGFLGKADFNPALDLFNSGLTEAEVRASFPKLKLSCAQGANPFGDRICGAAIGSFNQIPASAVTLFLQGDQLRAAKVAYQRPYHDEVRRWIDQRLTADAERRAPAPAPQEDQDVIAAPVRDGMLILPSSLKADEEPALIWLSQAAIEARR